MCISRSKARSSWSKDVSRHLHQEKEIDSVCDPYLASQEQGCFPGAKWQGRQETDKARMDVLWAVQLVANTLCAALLCEGMVGPSSTGSGLKELMWNIYLPNIVVLIIWVNLCTLGGCYLFLIQAKLPERLVGVLSKCEVLEQVLIC